MYKAYIPYLQHILDECLYIRSAISDEMQMEEFLRDVNILHSSSFIPHPSFFIFRPSQSLLRVITSLKKPYVKNGLDVYEGSQEFLNVLKKSHACQMGNPLGFAAFQNGGVHQHYFPR